METYLVKKVDKPLKLEGDVPGSKSITNRALLMAAMAEGESLLKGVLFSDDSRYFLQALKDLGIVPDKRAESELKTHVYFDATEGEWLPIRGSSFRNTSNSGASALSLYNPRSNSYDSVGFRSAFYEVNGKLITE